MFVLAVEPAVVAAHVEVAHEKLVQRLRKNMQRSQWSTLGWRFLEKIVQLPLSLPRPDAGQINDYLTSLFVEEEAGGQPAPDTSAADAARDKILLEVRDHKPTLDALPELINSAVAGLPEEHAASVRAGVVAEVLPQFFRDSDPLVQQIVKREASLLPSRNAREIKRFLNLFRFYSFIAARRNLLESDSAATQRATLERVAKLGVLSIRWPFLLDPLSRPAILPPGPPERGDRDGMLIQFETLEAAVADDTQWREAVLAAGLIRADPQTVPRPDPDWLPEFRDYLRREPRLGPFVRAFL